MVNPTQPDHFAKYIPGFEFLNNLTRQAAAGTAQASAVPGMPSMNHWVAPTFDVEEIDKRIQDLRAVHFWLDQNTKALAATIQALEVQKMTLVTLKSMNVSLAEMADAFKMPAQAVSTPPQEKPPLPESAPEASPPPAIDPMQWWNALTQQFQAIAVGVARDMAEQTARVAAAAPEAAPAPGPAPAVAPVATPESPAPRAARSRRRTP